MKDKSWNMKSAIEKEIENFKARTHYIKMICSLS